MKDRYKIALFALALLAVPSCSACVTYGTEDEVTAIVTGKERIVTGHGENLSSKYLVFTEAETFENRDSLWYAKWGSSDVQGRLNVGQSYKMKVHGFRIPFLSMYRNIVSAEPQ